MEQILDDVGYWEKLASDQETGVRDDCIPHFYMRPIQHMAKSEALGRPVFDEVAYVRILVPGDRNNVVDRKVADRDRDRWPRQWSRFLAKRELRDGTPIEHWPYLGVARVAELKALEVFTVEELAQANEALLERIGAGAIDLKTRAGQFLQPQSKTETKLRSENAKLRREIAALKARVANFDAEAAGRKNDAETCKPRRRK